MQPSAPWDAYLELGQPQLAIPHLKAALPIDDDGNLHCLLARAYQTSGQADLRKGAVEGLPADREVGGGREPSCGASSADCATLKVWPVYYTSYRT